MADCSRTLGLLLGQLRLVEGRGAERVGDSGCMWNPVLQGGHPVRRDLVLSGEIFALQNGADYRIPVHKQLCV